MFLPFLPILTFHSFPCLPSSLPGSGDKSARSLGLALGTSPRHTLFPGGWCPLPEPVSPCTGPHGGRCTRVASAAAAGRPSAVHPTGSVQRVRTSGYGVHLEARGGGECFQEFKDPVTLETVLRSPNAAQGFLASGMSWKEVQAHPQGHTALNMSQPGPWGCKGV